MIAFMLRAVKLRSAAGEARGDPAAAPMTGRVREAERSHARTVTSRGRAAQRLERFAAALVEERRRSVSERILHIVIRLLTLF
jgi:hypothetical protein